ncbi:MAG: hypothetical protein CM15mP49_16890 [Actinomycetota bacterium]|nr:MAG: hypothetical protein CM15mP49_16890 [Actinomycetota bacterium]
MRLLALERNEKFRNGISDGLTLLSRNGKNERQSSCHRRGRKWIWYACAKIFAAEGAEIVIAGRRGALATETANEFNGLGVSWDVTDFEQGKRAQEEVMANMGVLMLRLTLPDTTM